MSSDETKQWRDWEPPEPSERNGEWPIVEQLLNDLRRYPKTFGFFQAVLLLSRVQKNRAEPGIQHDSVRESILLRGWPSLVRSATDIRSLKPAFDPAVGPPYEMEISFMGLYGLGSPTPSYFWDYVQTNPESALREMMDIFGSRWIGLFYQAWKRYRWPLVYGGKGADPMTRRALCLLGLGTERAPTSPDLAGDSLEKSTTILAEHEGLDPFPDRLRLLAYAGLLAPRTRPAWNAQALLADYFAEELGDDAQVEIEENVFQWAYLSLADTNRLGQANSISGARGAFIIGTRVPDRMGAFRIHLGPLPFASFAQLLPYQNAFRILLAVGRLASPFGVEFDVDLKLKAEEVPGWKLGGETGPNGRLGWTTWAQADTRTEPGIVRLRAPAA